METCGTKQVTSTTFIHEIKEYLDLGVKCYCNQWNMKRGRQTGRGHTSWYMHMQSTKEVQPKKTRNVNKCQEHL